MVRAVGHILLTLSAVAMLGLLLLLSTSAEDDAQRRLDHVLRQLRDAGTSAEREVLDARNVGTDNAMLLAGIAAGFKKGVEQIGLDLKPLYPVTDAFTERFATQTARWFNAIEAGQVDTADPATVWQEFAALDQSMRWFIERLEAFAEQHGIYLRSAERVGELGRDFVSELRERGQEPAADAVFRATQQVLERARNGGSVELAQIDNIAERLEDHSGLKSGLDKVRLDELGALMRTLVPAKRRVEAEAAEIVSGRFNARVTELRDIVTRDYLYRLNTVNDARVLLNVYTVLLLLVLGYFGFRLQRSYRALNASHSDLEERVQERTHDLEKAYNDLTESQVQLVQAEKMSSLGQLVAGIMHEINTPLLYVINNAEVTGQNVVALRDAVESAIRTAEALAAPEERAQLKDALAHLREAVNPSETRETMDEIVSLTSDSTEGLLQISQLVQSLKDFSRLDRAGEDKFDVREGLDKTLTITRNLLKYGITVEKHFDEVPEIVCSPSRINQVFINLITNAAQAMDGKGTLTLIARQVDDWVQVVVRDTGCGIPRENLQKILDPFFTTKPVGQGTGLGLSIVKQIVDEHGGRLDIASEIGEGTEFTISLPLVREPMKEAA